MKALAAALREVAGLFVDDGSLALEILAVVVLAALAATVLPAVPLAAGGILLLGCVGVLFANVARATRRR
jgi:hypothetical protein